MSCRLKRDMWRQRRDAVEIGFDRIIERRGSASFKWDTYPPDVLPAFVADMDFASPPAVLEALHARTDHGVFGYARVSDSLIEAVCDHARCEHGWHIDPDWLVFLPGVWSALGLTVRAFTRRGEGVLMVTPIYHPFLEIVADQGRRLDAVPAVLRDGRWELPLAELEAAIRPDTRVLLFSSPHNPLGRAFDRDEIAAVVDLCRRRGLVFCSDEVHCDLILDPLPHVPSLTIPGAEEVTLAFLSPSKTYNLPGLQLAWGVIPDEGLRRRFREAAGGLVELDLPGVFGMVAAEAAYRHGGEWRAALLDHLRGNGALIERFVADELPGVTTTHVEATYLAWLDARQAPAVVAAQAASAAPTVAAEAPSGVPGAAAARVPSPYELCLAAGVAVSDGAAFGAPGFLRINFGCPRATLQEVLRRVRRGLTGRAGSP